MLAGMGIEHEVDEGAFEARTQPHIDGESGTSDLGGTIKVKHSQTRPEVPVCLRFEIHLGRLAEAVYDDVVISRFADRDRVVRQIRNPGQHLFELDVNFFHRPRQSRNAVRHLTGLHLQCIRIGTFLA